LQRSACGTGISIEDFGGKRPEIAKFPVKFPVSREFAWRRVRSALRRQPKKAGQKQSTNSKLPSISIAYARVFATKFPFVFKASQLLPAAPRDMDATWFVPFGSVKSALKPPASASPGALFFDRN
jgi:hypothetical protein